MSCNLGLHSVIVTMLNNKPWFNYKEGNDFIKILDSPKQKINHNTAIGVANTVAKAVNDKANKYYPNVGEMLYSEFDESGRGYVSIKPTDAQLNYINAIDDGEQREALAEMEEERQAIELSDEEKSEQLRLEQDENEFLQTADTPSSTASPETIATIKDFLKRIGVDIKKLQEVVIGGVKQDANGAALIAQRLIQIVEGKENVALTEEAMHFAVEIIEQTNPVLFNKLLKEINSYNVLADVFKNYSSKPLYQINGKPDIRKLKKEAIAKILTETIILQNEGSLEKPFLLAKTQSWWNDILDFIKSLFVKSGFDRAAMDVLSGKNIGTVEVLQNDDVYLQTSIDKQSNVWDRIVEIGKTIDKLPNQEGYSVGGKVTKRFTDFIKSWYKDLFNANNLTKSEYQIAIEDLKKDKETMGHSFLERAFKLFVDDNGRIRAEELLDDEDFILNLSEVEKKIYATLKENLKLRLLSFENGTRFMSEVSVYDEKRNLAETIDFIAISPIGKVNVLDWKFMDLNINKYDDVPWFKIEEWNKQMVQYKQILKNAYGVYEQDFDQTQMIPIKTKYSGGNEKKNILPKLLSIEIGDVNFKNITKPYLLPVPLAEQTTGNKKLNELLEKLNSIYAAIKDKQVLSSNRDEKNRQLNALFSAIRQLQMRQNLAPLISQANLLNKRSESILSVYEMKFKGKDPNSFSEEDLNNFSEEISVIINRIAFYTNLDTELKFLFSKTLSEEDSKIKESLKEVSENSRELLETLNETYLEFTSEIIAKGEGEENILSPEKAVRGIGRWFSSTVTIQLASMHVLYKKASRALTYSGQDTLNETKKLGILKAAYDKLASSKGWSMKNYFNLIKKKDKNELIDEFNPEFYKTLRKKLKEKDFKWIQENVNVKEYEKLVEDKKAEEIQKIEDRHREGTETQINAEITKEKLRINLLYNIASPSGPGWLQYKLLIKVPNRTWETNEWKELHKPENIAALDFYNYIIERNQLYQDNGYINKGEARTFLPFVRKTLMEKLSGFGGKVSLGEQFIRNISLKEGDVGYGKIDPLNGKIVDSIPIYFTQEIEEEVSDDLFRTMSLYNEMAIKHRYLKTIEFQIQALINLERNKKTIATSYFGATIYKNGILQYHPSNDDNVKLIEDTAKAIIYGQKYIQSENFDQMLGTVGGWGKDLNKKLGMKIFPENLEGRQISINKIITQLNTSFQMQAMGLNPLSALSNLFGGTAQSIINSGKYFTKTDLISTELWLFANKMGGADAKKALAALEYFLPLTQNYNTDIAKKLSISKLSQENIQEFLMVLMRNSDYAVQTLNFFSFLKNTIVENGEIVNAREYLRKQPKYNNVYARSVTERKALDEEFNKEVEALVKTKGVMTIGGIVNNEFVIPGINRKSEGVVVLRRKVQQISKDALGNLSEDEVRMIMLNIYGKSFMLFKSWIPRLADVRFGNLKYNVASDAYEWGRMRMVYRIISKDIIGSIGNLSNALMANENGVEYMRKMFDKKKYDYEQDTGKTLNMTESEFIDLVRKNIKGQLIEVIFLLSLIALIAGLKALAPDDDEDDAVRNQYKFLLRASDKLKDELLYFYDPTSLSGIVSKGIFPSMALLNNYKKILGNFMTENYAIIIGDEEKEKDTYVLKYVMKAIPGVSVAQSYLPMFYPELAKDLGIRTQSTSGIRN